MNFIKSLFSRKDSGRIAELEAQLELDRTMHRKVVEHNTRLHHENASMMRRLEQLSAPIVTKALTKVTFTCVMPEGHHRTSEFTLGLGRCGKTVERLELTKTNEQFVIKQIHTDHSHKTFSYKMDDIIGRVQECYETISVEPGTKYAEQMREQLAYERRMRMPRFAR